MKRGEIWLATFDPARGHEMRKTRPAVIVQHDILNEHGSTTVIAPITSQGIADVKPFEVFLPTNVTGLPKSSKVLLQHLRSVDKRRVVKRLGSVDALRLAQIEDALRIVFALEN